MLRAALCVACIQATLLSAADTPGWRSQRIHDTFYTEGGSVGDIDGDGNIDVVAGPMWVKGPEFQQTFELAPLTEFNRAGYGDQFFSSSFDATGDGATDVLVIGFPGKEARLYVNPGADKLDSHWPMHIVTGPVDNESPAIVDLIPGGTLEIVCGNSGQYGFYQAGKDATQPWTWTPIAEPGSCPHKFTHGMGVGDVNGDGRLDVLGKTYWWEQPASVDEQGGLWKKRQWALEGYGGGGAQICVDDVDGDGDNDIVTSYNAHAYGLGWFEQITPDRFIRHEIMGQSSTDNPYGVAFSQLHAVALADIDGDGRKDIVTGKRFMAHNFKDPGGMQEPVLYWFRNVAAPPSESGTGSNEALEFVPHLIDNQSGVGVDTTVADLNGDGSLDIVTASKIGLILHFQDSAIAGLPAEKWQLVEGRDQSKYTPGFTPDEAAKNMLVPDGFHVDLIASEPDLTQPIAMCFDAKGRIWVVEGHTYPQKAPAGQGKDRIIVLEDADGDGSFETKKTFAEGINLASGIEVGFGGVWVGAAPELLFYPDADHDCVPDAEPTVLLDGWHYEDTHETLNSFTWGPDGWLYGCHGVFTHSVVGKPGTPEDQRQRINAGIWRYHPTRHEFEVYAHGTSNPWGLDYDENGEWFVEACVIPHLFHIVQGARYQRQAGQHFNKYTYDDIKTIADHAHYVGSIRDHAFWGDNHTTRPAAQLNTSQLGGGHAHCGFAFYNGDVFPPQYRGDAFIHNLHGHRLVREHFEHEGSGFIGRHRPDFALSQDHNQIGVGVMVGPDGAIYTSDWHDPQTCHNRTPEIWDRSDGRLFRLRYGDVKPTKIDLWAMSDEQLVRQLASANAFVARQAQRVLQERSASKTLETATDKILFERFVDAAEPINLRYLWSLHVTESISIGEQISVPIQAFNHPEVQYWLITALGERKEPLSEKSLAAVITQASNTQSPIVRRAIASLLQRIPHDQRWDIAAGLVSHRTDEHDRNIPYLVWYGIEPLVADEPGRALALARKSGWANLTRFTIRRMAETEDGREQIASTLAKGAGAIDGVLLEELVNAANSRGGVKMPTEWPKAFARLADSGDANIANWTRTAAVQFGDPSVVPYYQQVALDTKKGAKARIDAIKILASLKDEKLPSMLGPFLKDDGVRTEAVAAMAAYDSPEIPEQLISNFNDFDEATRTAALGTLASRRNYTNQLVTAMEAGTIKPNEVPAFIVRQAMTVADKPLLARLETTWGKIGTTSADKKSLYTKYHNVLKGRAFEQANTSAGRVLYDKNCGKCHRLFDSGGNIGPNITGANRTSIDYWLENIIEPNALIGKDYQTTTFILADGRVVSGLIADENDDAVTVQTATDKVVISKDDIDDRNLSPTSLMPEGQLEQMSQQQVRELIAYLMSPTQVSLPREKVDPNRPGLTEGESLVSSAKVDGGGVSDQGMRGFGPDWSGDNHLWWTGGKVGSTMELTVQPQVTGKAKVVLQLTRAHDYGKVTISGDGLDAQEVDLFDTKVSLAPLVVWTGVSVSEDEPLRIKFEITGKNPAGTPRYMVGLDYILVEAVK